MAFTGQRDALNVSAGGGFGVNGKHPVRALGIHAVAVVAGAGIAALLAFGPRQLFAVGGMLGLHRSQIANDMGVTTGADDAHAVAERGKFDGVAIAARPDAACAGQIVARFSVQRRDRRGLSPGGDVADDVFQIGFRRFAGSWR